ncbi:MAG: 50S ribosomal protein L17 [Candidatus Omnitrophica bacterium]|nr:50S ribosomal protein L17 [Candidatus Omnitrophota bacterium]
MRHHIRTRTLNRTTSERKALLRGLVSALLRNQRITTTLAKAKEAKRLADKVITLGKYADLASQRRVFAVLSDRDLVRELVTEIAPRFKSRQGGYTRIIRLSAHRKGDNAQLVILELTEQKVIAPPVKKVPKEKKHPQETQQQKTEKTAPEKAAPVKEKPVKTETIKQPRPEKGKKGFFQGLKRFLKPKTG